MASPVPTTQGIPNSRETIAAWQVMPPESVTIAPARRNRGSQSGEVMCVTSTSPSFRLAASASETSTRAAPLALPGAPPRPCSNTAWGSACVAPGHLRMAHRGES